VIMLRQQYDAVKPGRYLHKKHWNTVTLDGSIPDEEVWRMIDESYTLVVQGMTRADRAKLNKIGKQEDGTAAG